MYLCRRFDYHSSPLTGVARQRKSGGQYRRIPKEPVAYHNIDQNLQDLLPLWSAQPLPPMDQQVFERIYGS